MVPSKKGDEFEFAPAAASKLLKNMTVRGKNDYDVDRLTLDRLHEAVTLAEKMLGGGEDILTNFKVRASMAAKRAVKA